MSAANRPRGATFTRQDDTPGLGPPLPRKPLLAAVAIIATVTVTIAMLANFSNTDPGEQNAEFTTEAADTEFARENGTITEKTSTPLNGAGAEQTAPEQPWISRVVKRGDTLSLVFNRAGFNDRDVYDVIGQSDDGKSLERIFPGQTIAFQANQSGELTAVRHVKSPLETTTFRRDDTGFESLIENRLPEVREAWTTGIISSSLFLAGQEAGMSQNMIMEMANIFGGVIDFVLDPRTGDTIQVVYEDLYLDGAKFRDGGIIAASFTNQGETFNAFRFTDGNGDTNYYNEEGVSMRKAFLMAPVDFTRISSNFNLRRLHPIYKTTRPHRGTDYAAPTGTPVFSAGDGRVSRAGYSRANGNYIFVKHGEQYITKYLHLNKRKVKAGQRVSQGQIIGSVGSTGAATGPHLHYEFLVNGVHRNPRTIHKKLPKAKSLPGAEMANFRQTINKASSQLAVLRSNNHLAMRSSSKTNSALN
ncbi:MAG: peptidoglycan DD-metalloendopeptidase family protein [Halioglobus sp.]|nr:peptidoglycan DD-metalloendopeptidase family protein [Halioglobus sp.]